VGAARDGSGRIDSPVVVDAAGAWARQVAASAGIHVPMVPTRHQVLITEPIEGVRPELPIVRIMDAAVYVRPCWGGFLAGGYETEPTQFEMEQLPKDFSIVDTPLDLVLRRLMEGPRAASVLSTAPLGSTGGIDDDPGRAAHRRAGAGRGPSSSRAAATSARSPRPSARSWPAGSWTAALRRSRLTSIAPSGLNGG
jgi:glycine/D-amino acid oxidase-like deaminating enzyme